MNWASLSQRIIEQRMERLEKEDACHSSNEGMFQLILHEIWIAELDAALQELESK